MRRSGLKCSNPIQESEHCVWPACVGICEPPEVIPVTDPRLRILSLLADAHTVHELVVATGDEERTAQILARVIDLIEAAHACLYDKGGTAIVQPGQAEPV